MSTPRRGPAAEAAPPTAADHGPLAELELGIPSDVARVGEAVRLVVRHVESHGVDPHLARFNLRVALGEALVNAILHGNGSDPSRQVTVRVQCAPVAIEVEVRDDGAGFDPAAVPDPTTPERIRAPGGRGIFLIRQLVDDVRFSEKGNVIWMTLRRA